MPLPHPSRGVLIGLDVVAAIGLVALSLYALTQPWDDGFRAHAGWLDVVAVTGMVAPFALRTAAPVLALELILAANLGAGLVGQHTLLFYTGFVPWAVLVYAVARHDDGWAGRYTLAWVPLMLLGDATVPEVRAVSNLVFTSILFGSVWGAGRVARGLARQSERLAVALARLELERGAGERQAVELERSRIAAEMHDVVGHALSLMVLQTGAARAELAVATRGGTAESQLRAAESTGRAALEELRRTVGVLRCGVPPQMDGRTSPR